MIPFHMVGRVAIACAFLLIAGCGSPGGSPAEDSGESLPGILTVPSVEDGIIYFAGGDALYAFDESRNEARWTATLDPAPDVGDPGLLPAPAPASSGSYVLVHIGRRLWGVSKVDGRTVWSVDGLPEASRDAVRRSGNPLPGYHIHGEDANAAVITLEEEAGWWFCRRRRLGDGALDWEKDLHAEPRGWWLDRSGLWVVSEIFGAEGPGSAVDRPAALVKLDPESGERMWAAPLSGDSWFRATLRATNRIYLVEKRGKDEFQVRAVNEESGELYRSITYSAGDFMAALQSADKLVLLHLEESEDGPLVRFLLYYSSLNPIQRNDIFPPRRDQLFYDPVVDRNLLLYAGTAYSLYNGNLVWREEAQRSLVDWAADEDRIYLWDSAGHIACLERLTGLEIWRTPFNVLPPEAIAEPNHGGAALLLIDGRLLATTPAGELFRLDSSTGELHSGVLRLSHSAREEGFRNDE